MGNQGLDWWETKNWQSLNQKTVSIGVKNQLLLGLTFSMTVRGTLQGASE